MWHCQVEAFQRRSGAMGAPPHAAVVAIRHCAAASDRKTRSVEREIRWRCGSSGSSKPAAPAKTTRGSRPRNPAPERKAEPIHEAGANSEILNKPEPRRISK